MSLGGYGITDAASTGAETTFTKDVHFDRGVEEKFKHHWTIVELLSVTGMMDTYFITQHQQAILLQTLQTLT